MRSQGRQLQGSDGWQGEKVDGQSTLQYLLGLRAISGLEAAWKESRAYSARLAWLCRISYLRARKRTAPSSAAWLALRASPRTPNSSDPPDSPLCSEPPYMLVSPPLTLSLGLADVALSFRSWASLFKEVPSLTPPPCLGRTPLMQRSPTFSAPGTYAPMRT